MSSATDIMFFFLEGGKVFTWGENVYGQLGLGDCTPRYEPTEVKLPAGVGSISAGGNHTIAIVGK